MSVCQTYLSSGIKHENEPTKDFTNATYLLRLSIAIDGSVTPLTPYPANSSTQVGLRRPSGYVCLLPLDRILDSTNINV